MKFINWFAIINLKCLLLFSLLVGNIQNTSVVLNVIAEVVYTQFYIKSVGSTINSEI